MAILQIRTCGGVFNVNRSTISIQGSMFTNNSASVTAGVGKLINCSIEIRDSSFWNNSALRAGGVFAVDSGSLDIDNGNFFYNKAAEGDVLHIFTNSQIMCMLVKVRNSRFQKSKAELSGTLISAQNNTVTIDTVFEDNCVCNRAEVERLSSASSCVPCSSLLEEISDIPT